MTKILVLLASLTFASFAADPAASLHEPEVPQRDLIAFDQTALRKELEFPQRDLATFDQKLKAARKAGVPETDTLLPQLSAAWLHGDAERVKALVATWQLLAEKPPGELERSCPSLEKILKLVEAAGQNPGALADAMKASRTQWLRQQAVITLEDIRQVDSAIDQWAIENNKRGGTTLGWAEVQLYLKKGTRLQRTGASVFGDVYGPRFIVDNVPVIPAATWKAFDGVVPWNFFKPFPIAGEDGDKK